MRLPGPPATAGGVPAERLPGHSERRAVPPLRPVPGAGRNGGARRDRVRDRILELMCLEKGCLGFVQGSFLNVQGLLWSGQGFV